VLQQPVQVPQPEQPLRAVSAQEPPRPREPSRLDDSKLAILPEQPQDERPLRRPEDGSLSLDPQVPAEVPQSAHPDSAKEQSVAVPEQPEPAQLEQPPEQPQAQRESQPLDEPQPQVPSHPPVAQQRPRSALSLDEPQSPRPPGAGPAAVHSAPPAQPACAPKWRGQSPRAFVDWMYRTSAAPPDEPHSSPGCHR